MEASQEVSVKFIHLCTEGCNYSHLLRFKNRTQHDCTVTDCSNYGLNPEYNTNNSGVRLRRAQSAIALCRTENCAMVFAMA
ncbi:hypothetical protein [Nostoc sp. CCY0012]|uniref:hypothetical protein n=1 Tax=Nostoc sp. CCY0012 TaxID=1056123 RepID=UPI0039C6929C